MSFSITNIQGIVSKAALAGQIQDSTNRGHELAAEHAAQNIKEEHTINLEKVEETNKPEESMDREANPEEMQEHEKEETNEDTPSEEEPATEEPTPPPGHPDDNGHIDFTV